LSDFYHDDPVEEVSGTRRNFKGIISLILLIAVGGTYLQTTLAANINLNSGLVVEFGQGVAATTACSGGTNLIVTPISSFQNVSGAGAFYFSSVKVSNIPSGCNGKDFIINAYNSSGGSPLAIFNSTSTSAVVYNNAGTFELGAGTTTGASITGSTGTFTLTFTTPVAAAASVFKLTIQSSNHAEVAGEYSIGATGPGGGKIFYYSAAGFNCGPTYSATGSPTGGKCNYLEVAPRLWSGLLDDDGNPDVDTAYVWAINSKKLLDVSGITNDDLADGLPRLALEIGLGYKNSLDIIFQGNGATTAAGAAQLYRGGTKSDWYLPTYSETNLLCQWAKGQTQRPASLCDITSGSPNAQTGNEFAFRFDLDPESAPIYWTSSERTEVLLNSGLFDEAFFQDMYGGRVEGTVKDNVAQVRPIRAF
jgi:hypothetical protein